MLIFLSFSLSIPVSKTKYPRMRINKERISHPAFHPCRFQKLHLACGSERLILRSPLQPQISLCEAPASPLQLPGGNVTITYSYAGARAPMGQGFLLSYSQGRLDRVSLGLWTQALEPPGRREGPPAPVLHSSSPWCLCRLADMPAGGVPVSEPPLCALRPALRRGRYLWRWLG